MAKTDTSFQEDVVRFLRYCDKNGIKPRRDNYDEWQRKGGAFTEGAAACAATIHKHLGPWKPLIELLSDPAVQKTLVYTPE